MWHEARRQERKIRGMLVDYRRRAERRRDFYEKIKADPTQFLQLHGRQCKIHLDPAVAVAADSSAAMMPWQGHSDNLIDRFDVRAHLDVIPNVVNIPEEESTYEERQCNYERYRVLAQNTFLGINEEKFLKQLHLEEQFGYTNESEPLKKRKGAAIGFNYEDGSAPAVTTETEENSAEENSDSDLDVDLCINISKIEQSQAHEMNRCGQGFGMSNNDFYSFLTNDMEEAENFRIAKEEEHEKALFAGRKSRRERRAHREKRLANRVISPPSYAARESPTYKAFRESKSVSKSPSPENAGQITYITSFGGDEEAASTSSKATYAEKVKFGKSTSSKLLEKSANFVVSTSGSDSKRKRSRSADRERDKKYRRPSKSPQSYYTVRNRPSRSHSRHRSRDRRSRSRGSWNTRDRDRISHSRDKRSRSRDRYRRSRSRSYSKNRRRSRSFSVERRPRRSRSKGRKRSVSLRRSSSSSSSSSSHSRRTSKSYSKSRSVSSKSRSTSRSVSKSPNRSPSAKENQKSPPKVTVQRYYGRKKSDESSSDITESDSENDQLAASPASSEKHSSGKTGTSFKQSAISNPNVKPQERLKRKMQLLLNKQFKADKIAEQLKTERAQQEQRNRDDELREMALKLRRKQRERRHAYNSNTSSSSSDSDSRTQSPVVPTCENRPPVRSRTASPPARERPSRSYRDARSPRSPRGDRSPPPTTRGGGGARSDRSERANDEPYERRIVYRSNSSRIDDSNKDGYRNYRGDRDERKNNDNRDRSDRDRNDRDKNDRDRNDRDRNDRDRNDRDRNDRDRNDRDRNDRDRRGDRDSYRSLVDY